MTSPESALSELAARLVGSESSLSTSLREVLTVAVQELSSGSSSLELRYLRNQMVAHARAGEVLTHRLLGDSLRLRVSP